MPKSDYKTMGIPEILPRNVGEPVMFKKLLLKYGWNSESGRVERLKR